MRLNPTLLLLTFGFATMAMAQNPVSIPIFNSTFHVDVLPCTAPCSETGLTGWIVGPQSGIFKASASQYPGIGPEGIYVAFVGNASSSGSIFQTLGATVQANTTYFLSIRIGARVDFPFTGYLASLMAGNMMLASGNKMIPVGGTFVDEIITYKSGSNPPQLGQPLQIFVQSIGNGQVNIAGVSLTAN